MRHKRSYYWNEILIYSVLSIALMIFYIFWNKPIVGLIVSLVLFFFLLNVNQLNLFKSLAQFRTRDLWFLLPVLLEWVIALPIQFMELGNVNWDVITNLGSKVLLNGVFMQLLLNTREEIATSFCWLMIAFLVMRLLKLEVIKKTQLKFTIVVLSILFSLGHYSNAIIIASQPALDTSTKIIGAAFVFINLFITGMFFKTVYIKTRSIQACVIVHFLCGLRRAFFPIISPQIGSMTLEQIGCEALVLGVYIVAIIIMWRKQWPLKELNEVYATQDAEPFELHA